MSPRRAQLLLAIALALIAAACSTTHPATSVVRLAGTACLKPIIGTGVAVGDDLVLTVAHTIAGAEDDLRIVTPQGEERPVTVVAFDSDRDLALLAVEGLDATPVILGSAGKGDSGTIAVVNGDLAVEFIKYTVLRVVNARSTDIYNEGHVERDALDIKARIEPGVSGAPLVDSNGEVVGIVFARSETREEGGYALSTSEITDFLDSVDPGTVADRGRCR
jgi:S1-C subfamily serine protease